MFVEERGVRRKIFIERFGVKIGNDYMMEDRWRKLI